MACCLCCVVCDVCSEQASKQTDRHVVLGCAVFDVLKNPWQIVAKTTHEEIILIKLSSSYVHFAIDFSLFMMCGCRGEVGGVGVRLVCCGVCWLRGVCCMWQRRTDRDRRHTNNNNTTHPTSTKTQTQTQPETFLIWSM